MNPYKKNDCAHDWLLLPGKFQRFRCSRCCILGYRALSVFGGSQSKRQPKPYRCKHCGGHASVARFAGTHEVFECASCSEARVAS